MATKSELIATVCHLVTDGDLRKAAVELREKCPNEPTTSSAKIGRNRSTGEGSEPATENHKTDRRCTPAQSVALFLRDGFLDRYSGEQLVYPGVLRLLSHLFPGEFPYHRNWKIGVGHSWYWELSPTVDHVVPFTHGGPDEPSNWVTTSMMRNLLKSNRPLADVGWELLPPGKLAEWNGLLRWYVAFVDESSEYKKVSPLMTWYRAGRKALDATDIP